MNPGTIVTIGAQTFLVLANNAQGHAVAPILTDEKIQMAGDVPFGKMRFIRTCEAFIHREDIGDSDQLGRADAAILTRCQHAAAKSAKTAEVVNTYASQKFLSDRKYRAS